METICQFGIGPGEEEGVDAKKAGSITSVNDLKGKNLGVTDIGSGTHTLTLALLGKANVDSASSHFVAVGAGDTFIAAIEQRRIDAGMTTEPTISRLLKRGADQLLLHRTPPA